LSPRRLQMVGLHVPPKRTAVLMQLLDSAAELGAHWHGRLGHRNRLVPGRTPASLRLLVLL
jgi:hypothetical protein